MKANDLKIRRISLWGAVVLSMVVSSCHREDYFYEIDDAPLFMWTSHTSDIAQAYLSDTVKIHHQQAYGFRCADVHIKEPVLAVADTIGDFEYMLSTGGESAFLITVHDEGTVQGSITATDIYGKSSEVFFTIKAFYNVKPVAKGTATVVGNLSDCEVEIDLSQSFDGDERQGGGIEQYEYKITSPSDIVYNVVTPLSKINYIFKEKGLATIEFRVCDNDGEWSEWETIYVKV